MADKQDNDIESLSASDSHALEPLAASTSTGNVYDEIEKKMMEEKELGQRCWSSDKSEEDDDDDDDDGWMVASLSERQHAHGGSEGMAEEDETDVEASVREALRLLEEFGDDGDGESEGEEEIEQWRTGQAERGYLDFVHEMMKDRWTLEDRDGLLTRDWRRSEGRMESEKREMKVEEDEDRYQDDNRKEEEQVGHKETDKNVCKSRNNDVEEKDQENEWQEAYTAKGRVYYYNRRTRESSWKKYHV